MRNSSTDSETQSEANPLNGTPARAGPRRDDASIAQPSKSRAIEQSAEMTFDELDEYHNPPVAVTDFNRIADAVVTRRHVLGAGAAFGVAAFAKSTQSEAAVLSGARESRLDFSAVAANTNDTATLPSGFRWYPVVRWGDPLWSGSSAFDPASGGTGESQERAFGDNSDGMALFSRGGNSVLAVNNEYVNHATMFPNRDSGRAETADDVRKSKAAHGVSLLEIKRIDGRWQPVIDSPLNRKVTADTPMAITGPARGHVWMQTAVDPEGVEALGTWNNCGNGRTPWGTYLTCEENFNGYFASSDAGFEPTAAMKRYGIRNDDAGYNWILADERFDISKHPNEPNRFGYVVEIDPMDPAAKPRKLTALGRFKHENAELVIAASGHVVVYLGDDERGEYLYKFVSAKPMRSGRGDGSLLESGTLHVAKFGENLRGIWIPLTPETTAMDSIAEICIHTRQAASRVGATTMDRPEWLAANPKKPEVYCALTNNKNRGVKENAGGEPQPVGGPNPRAQNLYGQVLRMIPDNGDHAATGFSWDLFVLAGNPDAKTGPEAGSANVNPDNMFNSPDGLAFDRQGLLWIQTDGNYSNEGDFAGMGNNQMLCADTQTGEIRRFLVGPRGCEVTGSAWDNDGMTMFVGIQHPGERGVDSHFPDGGDTVPRATVIAIEREDGLPIG